jgi:predicted phage terminase large subunit-like protein
MQQQIIKSQRTKPVLPEKEQIQVAKTKIMHWLIENPYLAQRELNNRRFFYFVRWAWSEISSEKLEINWHMEYICDTCQEAVERVGMNLPKLADIDINVPPGSTKTSIVAILLNVWCWTRWYWMKFITVTYGSDLSIESADKTRDVIRSDKFQAIYPELEIKQDKEAIGNFRIIKKDYVVPGRLPRVQYGGTRLSTSVGAKVTGFHGHVIIVDDPIDPEHAYSKGQIDSTNRWLDQTLSTRKINKAVTLTITIMQRVAQNDPTGHHLSQPGLKIKHICLPGEIFEGSQNVKPQELVSKYKDGLLDPVRLSIPILEEMKAKLGQYGYAGQVLQTPTPALGGMFKVDHFSIIDRMPPEVDILEIVRYWDKAGTKEQADGKGKACYTVGTKMARLVRNQFVVMDVKRGRWASEEREDIILSTAKADGVGVKIYYEQEPGSGGKQSAEATTKNLTGFAAYADLPHGDKVYRADPFSVSVNSGQVMLLQGEWNKEYVEEFRFFPFSMYKDQVDASSGAYGKLTGSKQVEIYGRR